MRSTRSAQTAAEMEPDAVEIRVVACLVEKQRTTPDAYPLSLNALRLACNQSTNRDPVVDYDEETVSEALRRTAKRGWTRLASGAGSRARKYRHLLPEALELGDDELALTAVLMLRGPQTPGELKQRSERLHSFADLAAVQATLERLVQRELVVRHSRRAGQKEDRFEQVLGGDSVEAAESMAPEAAVTPTVEPVGEDRLDRIEREITALRSELASLREALGEGEAPSG
ncbi:MAG TPA: YceH family protein [Solirubrobacterales bacterium]|nr:YceH family protein [Solirubrobacterales bacterium]